MRATWRRSTSGASRREQPGRRLANVSGPAPVRRRTRPIARRTWLSLLLLAVLLALAAPPTSAQPTQDYDLEEILTTNVFRRDDLAPIRRGEIVQRNWSEYSERDIAIALAFLLPVPPATVTRRLVEDFSDLRFDDRVEQVRVLPGQVELEHFAGVVLGEDEAERYLHAEPGTELNLSREEIARFAALREHGAGRADVERTLRAVLLDRYRAYAARGTAGIAPYARGDGKDLQLGPVLERDIRREPAHALTPYFRELMLEYPERRDERMLERYVWIEYEQDGRPNFVLRHRMALRLGQTWAMMERDFYVTHFYNAVQGFAAMLPSEGGSLVFYGVRSNTEQARGMGAAVRRALGRRIMTRQLVEMIELRREAAGSRGEAEAEAEATGQAP